MGPNGSGKSTLSNVILGHPKYEVLSGKILYKGEDITALKTYERAQKGIFLGFQYPTTIPGVTVANFVRSSMKAVHGKEFAVREFSQWNVALLPETLSTMLGIALRKSGFFALMVVIAGFSVRALFKHRGPFDTLLIISGAVSESNTQRFDEMRPLVEKLVKAQTRVVNTILTEAEDRLKEEDDYEAGIRLLRKYPVQIDCLHPGFPCQR